MIRRWKGRRRAAQTSAHTNGGIIFVPRDAEIRHVEIHAPFTVGSPTEHDNTDRDSRTDNEQHRTTAVYNADRLRASLVDRFLHGLSHLLRTISTGSKFVTRVVDDAVQFLAASSHHNLPTLHGLLTRHGTGALPTSLRWLQRRAWVRRAAPTARPSDTTPGGDQ